ncbi:MAG: hypothetical protein OHK0029_31690 [Armatimonadaceae bacterium]
MQLRSTQYEEEALNARSRISNEEMQEVMRLYDEQIGIEHKKTEAEHAKKEASEELPTIGDVAEILGISETETQRLLKQVRGQRSEKEAKAEAAARLRQSTVPLPPNLRSYSQIAGTQTMPNTSVAQNARPVTVFQIVDPHAHLFEKFERHGGAWTPTWNWGPFLFNFLWYFYKGMWAKGLIIMLLYATVIPATAGAAFPLLPIILGLIGNYDYYMLRRHNTQFWEKSSSPTQVTIVDPSARPVQTFAPPVQSQTFTSTADNQTKKFQLLRDTYEHGLITREEYEAKRYELLQEMEREAALRKLEESLRKLEEAYRNGILTAEEYAEKRENLLNSRF